MKKKVQPINRYIIFIETHVIINHSFGLTDFVLTQWSWLAVSQPKPLTRHELFVRKGYASLVSKRLTQRQSRSQSSFPLSCNAAENSLHLWRTPEIVCSLNWALILRPLVKGNKDSGNKTGTENKYLSLLPISPGPTYSKMESSRFREIEILSIPYRKVVFIAS